MTDISATEKGQVRPPLPSAEEISKLPKDGGPNWNRLIFEQSPYLQQHAANPVDWYPWGDEAFEIARKEDKPVFLSIGYSTCHWCHVMEHESFEDEEVAKLMNQHFINIKVDREERPDIDHIYMSVCQALTGSGGWPLTVLMTPEKKPFFAGTYYPKRGGYGRPGMMELVPQLSKVYHERREDILKNTEQIMQFLEENSNQPAGDELTSDTLTVAFAQLQSRYDSTHGGFGSRPKFPTPHNLSFILRQYKRSKDPKALEMVEHTLQQMRLGGIFDHVGFGFHRYSTDERWFLPHFEKMLYDQAMLMIAYTEAWQITKKEEYKQTVDEIATYILRDMTSPEGGFYSAEDADSEGEEGLFYLWTPEEIIEIVGKEEGELFNTVYNITRDGNFYEEATGHKTGKSIPYLKKPLNEIAAELVISYDGLAEKLDLTREKLFQEREKRIHPLKDDKILTDWNGLMITAFAKSGQAFGNEEYTNAAQKSADFVLSQLKNSNGRLMKRARNGNAGLDAHVEDYAFVIQGLLNLYEATFEYKYLEEASQLNEIFLKHFWDEQNGGFFMTADDSEELIVRSKEIYDGAIPSGNSIAALNLLMLGRITGDSKYDQKSLETFKAFSNQVRQSPSAYTQLMIALDFAVGPSNEVVIVGDLNSGETIKMLSSLREEFIPNKVVLFRPDTDEKPPIVQMAEYTENQRSIDGKATAYVCRNFACKQPTNDPKQMLKFINE